MSVAVPPAISVNLDANEHVDRLDVGRLVADTIQVGDRGTSGWVQYTPTFQTGTFGTNGIVRGLYQIIGKTMFLRLAAERTSNAGGVAGAGTYTLTMPPGILGAAPLIVLKDIVGHGRLEGNSAVHSVTAEMQTDGARISFFISREGLAHEVWSSTTTGLGFDDAGAIALSVFCVIPLQ